MTQPADPLAQLLATTFKDSPQQIIYEPAEACMVMQRVKPGMTVFDVGANVGDYAILMGRLVGPAGRVITIEAAGSTFAKLTERLARHGCDNVRAFHNAVYSENRAIEFHEFPEEYSAWNSLGKPQMADPTDQRKLVPLERTEVVQAVRLDDFCRDQGVDVIHYMKLDVEGAESDALKGASALLARRAIRFLQFEISKAMLDGMNRRAREVFDILNGHGYECHRINRDGTLGPEARDSDSFYENYAAFPRGNVHFLTAVRGEHDLPFLRHHADELAKLTFDWHWHLMDATGAAQLDDLSRERPGRVVVHRKPAGGSWGDVAEMFNAPLQSIAEDALVHRLDPHELWTAELLATARQLFIDHPAKTAAFYWAWFFVAPGLVTSTRNCYGNDPGAGQWLRTWRFRPGMWWADAGADGPVLAEPLASGQWRPVHAVNPFPHDQTEAAGCVFQSQAFVNEAQVRAEQARRSAPNLIDRWRALRQATELPAKLRDFFPWVTDDTEIDRAEYYVANPVAVTLS